MIAKKISTLYADVKKLNKRELNSEEHENCWLDFE